MKKMNTPGKKLRLNAQTVKALADGQLQHAAGGMPNTGNLTDVPPNCGTFNC